MKKLLTALLLTSSILGFAQNLISNVPNRNTTSLNGVWNYIIDPYQTGFYSFHLDQYDKNEKPAKGAFFSNYHTQNKQELVEYDFDKSPTINIPSDWNSQVAELKYYEGNVWFKKSFDYNLKDKKRLFLYLGAINYKADVYLNGKKLGTHEGGFTPFNYEVTSIVQPKGNYLVIKVDNTRHKEDVPTVNTDWWNYGGITRDVTLIEEEASFVEDYTIQLKKGNKSVISGFIKINNFDASQNNISISIPELKINFKGKADAQGILNFEIPAKKISYWSPESPKLYDVTIDFNGQKLKDQIGFRTIETNEDKILLNGKPVFLRGISIHEENAKGGRANSVEDALRLLNWAKEMGCNYVRLAHYPHNENIIREADKMGIMVWEEIPVYWTVEFTNKNTYQNAEDQLTTSITRDKNRASIIIWSMANETPISEARNTFIKNLASHTRSLDNTRLISAALLTKKETIDDPIGEVLDVVAFNQYLGWYGGNLEDAEKITWKSKYNKPIVVSEFGGDAKAGFHGEKNERWTEEYQEYLYIQNLKMIEKIPHLSGTSPWILVDFRSPKRLLPGIQDGYNRKGLISNDGEKKKAFYIMQDWYLKKSKE
ncbi:glycoside hydrolase family 2 protein [Flavobacterium johnsoniae]|uniref:Beta-glucuronidase n=1 Tax=Flavobacterium johnsoniae (strain ATCC 17061 / DSM 2064 / JCM 8514 / BCRC 14874 / CCUG 350202 / NBRC 14942 / NCIMB 11054 / UW101) TaxID=376686 RepID=A5FC62_FLAJ1|nr:glycoside hydrolase family 2 TIM barrel-domain containing protein [Flavobacterium johnsoniae]ABQ07206.1 Candidate beta-glucuronidase; Glycoside hydrolase family 2 [Flavobacterium johnsoniae UW101]OXE95878.1 beta-glucuronidase [Flavobacterium johnsoniae UW101]WQG80956.1 glycoside hydrolase family 2 TIM barrel-domain containing protein [Flavobacterium johnsoniae UW101]